MQLVSQNSFHHQRYHADKNPASVYGEEWAVMAEEISKALGSCYNMMKSME
jgi:hypothetical protein